MDRLKILLPLLLLLVFLLGFVEGFRSFFIANIIRPIAIVCWAAWRIIASVDQNIYWMLLIGVCVFFLIRLIPNASATAYNPAYNYTNRAHNRVEYWKTLMTDAALGEDELESLRDSLQKLVASSLAQNKKSDPINFEEMVSSGNAPLSLRAQRFLFPPKESGRTFSFSQRFNIIFLTPRRFRRWAGKFVRWDTTPIDEILEWIEKELEIPHDK